MLGSNALQASEELKYCSTRKHNSVSYEFKHFKEIFHIKYLTTDYDYDHLQCAVQVLMSLFHMANTAVHALDFYVF